MLIKFCKGNAKSAEEAIERINRFNSLPCFIMGYYDDKTLDIYTVHKELSQHSSKTFAKFNSDIEVSDFITANRDRLIFSKEIQTKIRALGLSQPVSVIDLVMLSMAQANELGFLDRVNDTRSNQI